MKVLVADDSNSVRSSLARVLEEHGFDVLQAVHSEDPRELLNGKPADVVVSDISMPGVDGLQLLAHTKTVDEDMSVVLMSSACFEGISRAVTRPGANALLPRPFSPADVMSAVERVLRAAVPRQAASRRVPVDGAHHVKL